MTNSSEASVEEILESIKKVIARDNRDDAIATRRHREVDGVVENRANPAPAAAPKAEITPEPTALTSPETDPDADAEAEILDLGAMQFAEDIDVPKSSNGSGAEAALTTEEARATMRENLEALAMIAQPSAPPQIVRSGETSLEGLTRELLRPMLSEWLDANLPSMVETLVKEEIARIARKES